MLTFQVVQILGWLQKQVWNQILLNLLVDMYHTLLDKNMEVHVQEMPQHVILM